MPEHSATDTAGLPPGVPVYTGDSPERAVSVRRIVFDGSTLERTEQVDLLAIERPPRDGRTHWFDVTGIANAPEVEAICQQFDVHPSPSKTC